MTKSVLYFCTILIMVFLTKDYNLEGTYKNYLFDKPHETTGQAITAMEALDLVKTKHAANFVKVYDVFNNDKEKKAGENYYYKLPIADYYLVYEGQGETEEDYLIHLYEFVVDEPETGIGHTVTYGWYTVNRETIKITEITY